MELLKRLAETASRQHEDADLPRWLVDDILALCSAPVAITDQSELYEVLLQQLQDFDSYAGAGCFGDSVSAATIAATLNRVRGKG